MRSPTCLVLTWTFSKWAMCMYSNWNLSMPKPDDEVAQSRQQLCHWDYFKTPPMALTSCTLWTCSDVYRVALHWTWAGWSSSENTVARWQALSTYASRGYTKWQAAGPPSDGQTWRGPPVQHTHFISSKLHRSSLLSTDWLKHLLKQNQTQK